MRMYYQKRCSLNTGVLDMEKLIKGIQECDLNGGRIGNCPYKDIFILMKEELRREYNRGVYVGMKMACNIMREGRLDNNNTNKL